MGCGKSQVAVPEAYATSYEAQLKIRRSKSGTQIIPAAQVLSDRRLTSASDAKFCCSDEDEEEQEALGPQSFRGDPTGRHMARIMESYVRGDQHREACFAELAQREREFCSDSAVFYHSYWCAAILYEVQAAIANVFFGFPSQSSPLPRLLSRDFAKTPDAKSLTALFSRFDAEAPGKADHHPLFRKVAISAMCSLMSSGPEVCIAKTFGKGYSCKGLPYLNLLETVLQACGVNSSKVAGLASDIIKLSEGHGLDASMYGGKPVESGKSGHLLQVFVRRDLVDRLAYAAKPYGSVDAQRMPLGSWMDGDRSFATGQARIVANPANFLRTDQVRIFVASSDKGFHERRQVYQQKLTEMLSAAIEPGQRASVARELCSSMPLKKGGHEQI